MIASRYSTWWQASAASRAGPIRCLYSAISMDGESRSSKGFRMYPNASVTFARYSVLSSA
jgi:hypothetical protein